MGGFKEILQREKILNTAVDTICGVAMALYDDSASIISSGCVFVAGLHTKHHGKRMAIIDILTDHKNRTGFPLASFQDELCAQWTQNTPR